jgi:hypothetical protein
MRTRRTKEQIRKDIYNKDVDAYNFYVVNLDTMKAETGFEFKEDAVDVLNDYDDKKKYKVVSKKSLKSLGIENPNESFKYETGGDFQAGVYAKGGGVKINTEVILSENRPNGAEWQGVVKPFMLKSIEENQYAGGFKRYEIDIYDEVKREPTKEEIKKANEFFDKIGGRYAGGGKIKPFMYKENNSTIMINGTKADVKKMYLDYKNNFLSVSKFAEYYNISERQANSIIESGRKYAKEDGYYAGGGEFMTDPTFGNFQNNVYADGGVTNNYIPRRNLNTITIKKGNQKLTYKISDVLNGAYKLESGAKLEDIAFYVPKRSIVKVQLKTGKDFKPANGYWIKDGAKPINISKFDEGGVMSKLLTRKKDQPKVETTDEDIDLNEDTRIRVRPSSFVSKDKEGDWMMKKNSSKEARSYAGGGLLMDKLNPDEKLFFEKHFGKVSARMYTTDLKHYDETYSLAEVIAIIKAQPQFLAGGGKTETPIKKGKGNHKMKATTDLAKKIRKDGEKWTDALRRASQQMK